MGMKCDRCSSSKKEQLWKEERMTSIGGGGEYIELTVSRCSTISRKKIERKLNVGSVACEEPSGEGPGLLECAVESGVKTTQNRVSICPDSFYTKNRASVYPDQGTNAWQPLSYISFGENTVGSAATCPERRKSSGGSFG
ncbi:hypothetical protein Scep_008018 [Stephania cephalantha]|uniref:Uncharacterized protein n=1 Tax=Stephania cephalantha TaxID=152367 RepID=A0AAP0PQK7_9MAGN